MEICNLCVTCLILTISDILLCILCVLSLLVYQVSRCRVSKLLEAYSSQVIDCGAAEHFLVVIQRHLFPFVLMCRFIEMSSGFLQGDYNVVHRGLSVICRTNQERSKLIIRIFIISKYFKAVLKFTLGSLFA